MKKPILLIFIVLLLDQILKIWVKTHLLLGEEIHLAGNWAIIHFTENNGMAFGMEFAGNYGKIFLSLFRIVAVFALAYYIYWLTTKKAKTGLVLSFALIFAGAFGNIIDSIFYGKIFTESFNDIAKLFPEGGGYSGLFHGLSKYCQCQLAYIFLLQSFALKGIQSQVYKVTFSCRPVQS